MTIFDNDLQQVIQLEKKLIASVYNNQPDIFKEIAAPDAIFVSGNHGYVDVSKLILGLANHPKVLQWEINNLRCIDHTNDAIILSYENKPLLLNNIMSEQYSTSIWKKQNNKWQLFFHQKSDM